MAFNQVRVKWESYRGKYKYSARMRGHCISLLTCMQCAWPSTKITVVHFWKTRNYSISILYLYRNWHFVQIALLYFICLSNTDFAIALMIPLILRKAKLVLAIMQACSTYFATANTWFCYQTNNLLLVNIHSRRAK